LGKLHAPPKKVSRVGLPSNDAPPIELIAPEMDDPYYKLLLYGHSKVGKSFMAGDSQNIEGMSPAICISFGAGYTTFMNEPRFAGLRIVRPQNVEEISSFFNWLRPDWDGDHSGKNKLVEYGWRTIIIDDLDRMHELLLRERMRTVIKAKEFREEDKPAQDDWGVARAQTLKIVDWFLALPAHVIMTCWAEKSRDAESERDKLMPSLPGKLPNDLAGRFGIVSYMEFSLPRQRKLAAGESTEGVRLAHFYPSNAYIAGIWGESRTARLGNEMENPSMQEVYQRLQG
jgi:hypothetical protein